LFFCVVLPVLAVFVWVPSLLSVANVGANAPSSVPIGLVFSAFMLAMTVGGMLFGLLLPIWPGGAEGLAIFVYMTSAIAMVVPIWRFEFWSIFPAFLVMEAMVGMFNSCGATLRSHYYPDALQSSIISLFRLPLNLIVVLGTTVASNAGSSIESLQRVYMIIAGLHGVACLLQIVLNFMARGVNEQQKKSTKVD
jgi:MFS transporter, MFS domain-containing protein family, molybdate-anion transporter